ncbi:MAG: ADP-ribosylglycohydrolase family protein [Dehalococcoidia bacterium]|nr:MAG: ADP-ribosylglycohydrolase family protein [Dehalococcoidia bacterium]
MILDRVRGGLYGVAVGDAFGAALEFMSPKEIKLKHGRLKEIVGGGWLKLKPGDWTDDTEMTLAVAEGILAGPHDPVPYIGERFLEWLKTNPPDIGNTIKAAFVNYQRLKDWHKAAEAVHDGGMLTAGNGALMRTLPVALAYRDAADIYMMSMQIARMTHWDPEAGLTCFLYCLFARELLSGIGEKITAWKKVTGEFLKMVPERFSEIAQRVVQEKLKNIWEWPESRLNPGGYTVDTLACAVWCFLNQGNFEEALVCAVNLGGDADTVGAVTGGLAGVHWGFDNIPERWTAKLSPAQKSRLGRLAEAFKKIVVL